MAPTANMNLVLPIDHGSDDTWDTLLDACFGLIDAHDHSNGKGVRVPVAGLDINADLSFASGGLYAAATDVLAIDFQPALPADVSSYAGALFVSSVDNNLYYRTTSGTNVKIIDGVSLNVAGFAGGIGGDYTAVGALLSFDDATDSYWLQQQGSPRPWARIRVGDVDIYETAASITNRVRLQSPAALAASYALTLFSALPGSTVAVQLSAAGVLSASNTFASAITAPDFRFSTAVGLNLPGALWIDGSATHARLNSAIAVPIGWTLVASANKLVMPLPLREGDVINSYVCYTQKNTNAAATITARLYRTRDDTAGTESPVTAGTGAETSSLNAPGLISLSATGIAHTVAAGYQYYLTFTPSGSTTPTADQLRSVIVAVTRP